MLDATEVVGGRLRRGHGGAAVSVAPGVLTAGGRAGLLGVPAPPELGAGDPVRVQLRQVDADGHEVVQAEDGRGPAMKTTVVDLGQQVGNLLQAVEAASGRVDPAVVDEARRVIAQVDQPLRRSRAP